MSKHTQFSFVSFPSSNGGSRVEPKSRSRRLEIGSLLRSKKLGGADLSSKKRSLDVDADASGKDEDGNILSTAHSQRVKRTRLHSGVSATSLSKLQASILKPKREESRRSDVSDDNRSHHRERTSSSSSVDTIRPVSAKECVEPRVGKVIGATNRPYDIGPAEPAKPVLTPSDVNIPKDARASNDNASLTKCAVRYSEDRPGRLLSKRERNALSSKGRSYDYKCLKSVEEFSAPSIEDWNEDTNPTIKAQEYTPPNVSIKLFKQHVELWDTKPSDVYIYRAQVHLTSTLSGFDPCEPPNVELLEISCTSLFPSPSPEFLVYYTGETTPGKRTQIDPSKGIHIGQRWWHSMPKEAGGNGAKGQWGWYLKMWIPIPMYVMRGREMGVFKVGAKVWIGDEGKGANFKLNPETLQSEKEFSVSSLRWTGRSFRQPTSSMPPSGYLVPSWSLVTH